LPRRSCHQPPTTGDVCVSDYGRTPLACIKDLQRQKSEARTNIAALKQKISSLVHGMKIKAKLYVKEVTKPTHALMAFFGPGF